MGHLSTDLADSGSQPDPDGDRVATVSQLSDAIPPPADGNAPPEACNNSTSEKGVFTYTPLNVL